MLYTCTDHHWAHSHVSMQSICKGITDIQHTCSVRQMQCTAQHATHCSLKHTDRLNRPDMTEDMQGRHQALLKNATHLGAGSCEHVVPGASVSLDNTQLPYRH